MKKRITATLALLITLLLAPAGVFAAETNFAAGSLIIPMDTAYQPDNDNGILEAYGLAYYLLKHMNTDGEHDITVHWVINPNKVTIDAPDLTIANTQAALNASGETAVVKYYNHNDSTAPLAYKAGDANTSVSYSGSVFIVDAADDIALAEAKKIIAQSDWDAVDLHEARVPFKAQVHRKMRGTPPRIALLDSKETGGGNAEILESYLRLAGICPDVYEVLTPYQVRDGALLNGDFDFLWAPHWAAFEDTAYSQDHDGNGIADADDIVKQVRLFIESGKALFAECASIMTFEKSQFGHYLASNDFGHNGGTNDAATIIYNELSQPYAQIGDFGYVPEGGHLHNWRPFQPGDPYETKLIPTPIGASVYNDTVTRFTIDDGSTGWPAAPYYANSTTQEQGWDYYVGGYLDGDTNNGYVVYLGGHKYAKCQSGGSATPTDEAEIEFEFNKDIKSVDPDFYKLVITYHTTSATNLTTTVDFDKTGFSGPTGDPLQAVSGSVDKNKFTLLLKNIGTEGISVDSFKTTWIQADQKGLKKITNQSTGEKLYESKDHKLKDGAPSGTTIAIPDSKKKISLDIAGPTSPANNACTNNSDCAPTNVAGVRYVLNTLFNIGFTIKNREFVRSAPVVDHPYLYQGSFEYPSYRGHFRKYDITQTVDTTDPDAVPVPEWDTGDKVTPHILPARDTSNTLTNDFLTRKVYTAYKNTSNAWVRIDFDADNLNDPNQTNPPLLSLLDVTPANNDNSDEINVVTRIRGMTYDKKLGQWFEMSNKLGGIVHSSPVLVKTNSRFSRDEVAYVGDAYGMIHAINLSDGKEQWAFIPPSMLPKLQNDRTDPNAPDNFPAVDGSPTAKDIYYQAPGETAKSWHTILVSTQGMGGTSVFAMDVTNTLSPHSNQSGDTWEFLWETTQTDMGHSRRAALGKVKWPVVDNQGNISYETKWVVFAATGYDVPINTPGGIRVYAIDLSTGDVLWTFTSPYADAVNDMPGPVTLFDLDHDTFMDRVYVGDMNGRLWELATVNPDPTALNTAYNPNQDANGNGIPLFSAGIGSPISVSPAIYRNSAGEVILLIGTGGTDWASNAKQYGVYAINATNKLSDTDIATYGYTGYVEWTLTLAAGEKVWSAPTIYGDSLYLATSFGTMESLNPMDDVAGSGNLYRLSLTDGSETWKMTDVGKTRASVFVDKDHLYLTTIDNELIQIGDDTFANDNGIYTVIKAWKEK